jgi:cyclopropane-fatty-acyl-phospholipid synthase
MLSGIELAERGLVPDVVIRAGIRKLLKDRLRDCAGSDVEQSWNQFVDFLSAMDKSPLAVNTADANKQHYEVPAAFYELCLGPRKKYSSCLYKTGNESLALAEEIMLGLTCERAGLADGMDILELGCGWGSLSLWMAEKYPNAKITAVSNSASQKAFIDSVAAARGFRNLTIVTRDMNQFSVDARFDRVVSVEMFEHMRNWRLLFSRIAGWLKPSGKLFFHIFVHKNFTYPFETDGNDDWMARHFFSGGIMPSFDFPLRFQKDLKIESQWLVSGTHYGRTARHWLENLDANKDKALRLFAADKNTADSPSVMMNRWRIFFMACEELWKYDEGREWFVGHYLFSL